MVGYDACGERFRATRDMRRNFLLTLGLAILGLVVVAATAGAGGGSVIGVGESGVEINIPDGGDLPEVDVLPQCSNLTDDDGDGVKDLSDPDCSGPLDSTESGSAGVPTTPSEPTPSQPGGGGQGGGGDNGGSGGGSGGGLPTADEETSAPDGSDGIEVEGQFHGHRPQAATAAAIAPTRAAASRPASRFPRSPTATRTAPRPTPTPASPSPTSARLRSASPTSSSTSSRSRRSCCRSTRPAERSTESRGRCSPRSTASRPPSART